MSVAGRKVLAVVTGASRGIGKQIAVQLSQKVAEGSVFVITARDTTALEATRAELLSNNSHLEVHVLSSDAAKVDDSLPAIEHLLSGIIVKSPKFDSLVMVHNAGTAGDITKKASELSTAADWHSFLQINLIAMIQINNLVLKKITKEIASNRLIVNITSLFAIKSFPSFSQYCVAKASREAFFRSLATEDPSLRILSYSPGPVQTDMYTHIGQNSYDESMRSAYQHEGTEVTRKVLTPTETVTKMFSVLDANTFENGGRIDYFDV